MLKTSDTTVCNLKVWNTWHFFVLQFCPLFPEVLLVRTASSSGKGVVSDTGYSRPSKEENGDEVKFRQNGDYLHNSFTTQQAKLCFDLHVYNIQSKIMNSICGHLE